MMTKIKDLQNLIKLAKTEEGPERVRTLKVAIKALKSLEKEIEEEINKTKSLPVLSAEELFPELYI